MRIFNEEKTQELFSVDEAFGRLTPEKLFVAHHEAVEGRAEISHYEVVCEYPNGGRDVRKVIDVPALQAQEAYDEYEDILVYIPYSEGELLTRKQEEMRQKRAPLLLAFDKWEKAVLRGREADSIEIMAWFEQILALNEVAICNIPPRVEYYV